MGVIHKELVLRGSRGKVKVLALFDSGASMSFVRRSVAEKLETVLTLPEPMKFETARSGDFIIAEEVARLEFQLDGEWLSDEFLVLPDDVMSEDCIIGAKTIQAWRIVIDMENERVYSARKVKKHMLKQANYTKQLA